MPILTTDLLVKLSVTSGSAGNSLAQANVNNSLGLYISTTQVTTAVLNNLFSDVTGTANAASAVDYRCIFIHNANASISLTSAGVYISSQVAGGTNLAIATDNIAASPIGSSSAQAFQAANANTSPGGSASAFSAPTSQGTALSLGTIPAGYCKAIWVQRTATNSAALNNDGGTLVFFGDTTA